MPARPFPFAAGVALRALLLIATLPLLAGCRSLAYYGHVGHGQWSLIRARTPLVEVIEDPATPAPLRDTLMELAQARRFASTRLALPDNGSYTSYVALARDSVTWNVFATPEFSVAPVTWCFPVAGCVPYRGYFDPAKARREAERLQARGYQTWVGGTAAYSTLGWFDDPILSTMLGRDHDDPVGVLFHELQHQQLYVRDDTAFNESLARFVEQEGLREWRAQAGQAPPDLGPAARERAFIVRVLQLRDTLDEAYRQPVEADAMRAAREQAIERFRAWYRLQRQGAWHDDARFDAWVEAPITNAKLVPFGLYDRWVPAFAALFTGCNGDWPCFHARTAELARQPAEDRAARLDALLHADGPTP